MKRFLTVAPIVAALVLAGCGSGDKSSPGTTGSPTATTSAAAAGCTASGLDAMTALSEFQLKMNEAQQAGKITVDQLVAARDKLFNQTQAAAANDDWAAYCKAIDDMRAELGM